MKLLLVHMLEKEVELDSILKSEVFTLEDACVGYFYVGELLSFCHCCCCHQLVG